MDILDLYNNKYVAIDFSPYLTIPDLLSLKITCKKLANIIIITLDTIRQFKFYTIDYNLVTYNNILKYIKEHKIATNRITICCKINYYFDLDFIFQKINLSIDYPNINYKTFTRTIGDQNIKPSKKKLFYNCIISRDICSKKKCVLKLFNNGTIFYNGKMEINEFYSALDIFLNMLKNTVLCYLKIINNSIKLHEITVTLDPINMKVDKNIFLHLIMKQFESKIIYQDPTYYPIKQNDLEITTYSNNIFIKQNDLQTSTFSNKIYITTNNYTYICSLHDCFTKSLIYETNHK